MPAIAKRAVLRAGVDLHVPVVLVPRRSVVVVQSPARAVVLDEEAEALVAIGRRQGWRPVPFGGEERQPVIPAQNGPARWIEKVTDQEKCLAE